MADRNRAKRRLGPHDPVAAVLRRAFMTVIGLAVLVGAVGVVAQILVIRSYDHLVDVIMPARRDNIEALQAMTDAEAGIRGFIGSGGPDFLDQYLAGTRVLDQRLVDIDSKIDDDRLVAAVANERAAADAWAAQYGRPAAQVAKVDAVLGNRLFEQFRAANLAVDARLVELRGHATTEITWYSAAGYVAMGLSILGAVVVGTVVGRRATIQLVVPLARTQRTLDAIADGDLDARARVSGPAELQVVAESVTRLAEQLAKLRSSEQARRDRDEAIRDVVQAVQTGVDVQDVLHLAVSAVGAAVGIDRAIFAPVIDGLVGRPTASWSAEGVEPFLEPPDGFRVRPVVLPGGVDTFGAAFAVEDVQAILPQVDDVLRAELDRNHVRSFLTAPVFSGTDIRGLLILNAIRARRAWTDEDRAVAEAAARELGVALARAEVYGRQKEMLDKLVELDRERDVFVYTVSHELRTPLTSIVGYLEMVEDADTGPLADEQRDMIGKVTRNAVRLQGLVSDLLTLARIQSGSFEVDLAPGTLRPIIDGVWDAIRPAAGSGGLSLRRRSDADDVELDLDPVQTDRMLMNLLSNAVKFTPAGGEITLTTARDGGDVVLEVADTGIGVPAEEQSKLFTRFFRASTARAGSVPGTGLGLSLVAAIVHKHGGKVSLASEPGRGTTVWVRLPAGARVERVADAGEMAAS